MSNFAEAHADFLGRCAEPLERERLILCESYHADRTLLWGGDPKLVFVSYPIAHADLVRSRYGFLETQYDYPSKPTYYLCRDIMQEQRLLDKIVEFAGAQRTIDLIPYAATPEFFELVDLLRSRFELQVRTSESPESKNIWLRDYIDTKNGFRSLASMWLKNSEDLLTLGISCYDMDHAINVVEWFSRNGETCVVKADTGESGIGTIVVHPFAEEERQRIFARLRQDPYFDNELIVVESYVPSRDQLSPSLEIKVPHLGEGKPEVTYVSRQLFLDFGDFCGIQVDKSLYEASWYPALESSGLLFAERLQAMGYIGHFDMDCIVRDDGRPYILEINARRTGGTHVHEFARHFYGDDYIEKVSLLSYEAMDSGKITDPNALLDALKDFLLPINGDDKYGLIITITSALHYRRFGCIAVAPSADLALKLQQDVLAYLRGL